MSTNSSEYRKQYAIENKDKLKAYNNKYYQENKETILAGRRKPTRKPREQCSKYVKYLDWRYRKNYGITYADFLAMLEKQNNVCAICNQPEIVTDPRLNTTRRLAVDHCHTTGRIRGLLCNFCNTALGKFKDNTKLLEEAIKYLKRNNTDGIPD